MTALRTSAWSTDYTMLCERFAERLRRQGVRHPLAAAVALAARGQRGVDRHQWAVLLSLPPDAVDAAESGQVPFDQLPPAIRRAAAAIPTLDLARLGAGTVP